MGDFLSDVIQQKRAEVALAKQTLAYDVLAAALSNNTNSTRSLKAGATASMNSGKPFVISEFKRSSPSAGAINQTAEIESVTSAYQRGGASAISVLTESQKFSGSLNDIERARKVVTLPILRKDFLIDPYQILEARYFGADLVLLISEALTDKELQNMITVAHSVGLEVLLEFHEVSELPKVLEQSADFIGVNCRNLRSLEVDWTHLLKVAPLLPTNCFKVAESGIKTVEQIKQLFLAGYNGFLIGEYLMRQADPEQACRDLLLEFDHGNL